MRKLFVFLSYCCAKILNLLPQRLQLVFINQCIRFLSEFRNAHDALVLLFAVEKSVYALQGQASKRYGEGIHTKHKHIQYHEFFVAHIRRGERVLDVGSGNGFLAYDIASQVPDVRVYGVELSKDNVAFAKKHYQRENLSFVQGDILYDMPHEHCDVVTMSNVLEHIEERVVLLKALLATVKPQRFIIRVPMFERDWRVPLKKELGVDYRLDPTHCIEYTDEQFVQEMTAAGLRIMQSEYRWGEIWSVVVPV